MPQPTPYNRSKDFTEQTGATTDNASINAELDAVRLTLSQTLANLLKIQRDDGKVANRAIDWDQLSENVISALGQAGGGVDVWAPATAYPLAKTVINGDAWYRANVAHTSGATFAADAAKWDLLIDFAAWANAASGSASDAATSATAASTSATNAANSATAAASSATTANQAVGVAVRTETASAGQTAFTAPAYTPGGEMLLVFVNGSLKRNYTESSATTITFSSAMIGGEAVVIIRSKRLTTAATESSNVAHNIGGSALTVSGALNGFDGLAAMRSVSPVNGQSYKLRYHTTDGDGGGGPFRGVTGAAAGTYVDDNGATIVPTGGDGSAAFVREFSGEVNVLWFGADRTGVAACDSASQAAIDYVAANDGGYVYYPAGTYKHTSTLQIKNRVSIRGDGINSTSSAETVTRLNFINTGVAKEACVYADKPTNSVAHVTITDILFVCDAGWDNIVKNRESHRMVIYRNYFAGVPNNAAIWLGATLYTHVTHNVFSLTGAIAIDARETNYDVTYYGTNWSKFRHNEIYTNAIAIIFTGIVQVDHNDIENTLTDCEAKIVVAGPSGSAGSISDNYFELARAPGGTNPLKAIKFNSSFNGDVRLNRIYGDNYEEGAGSIAIDCNAQAMVGEFIGNTISRWRVGIYNPSSSSRMSENNSYLSCPVEVFPNRRLTATTNLSNAQGHFSYTGHNDLCTHQIVTRGLAQNVTSVAAVALAAGQNISVNVAATPVLERILDAGLFPGAIVTLSATQAFTIAHQSTNVVLHAIRPVSGGDGYTTATVTISGGYGCTATANIIGGQIQSYTITNAGTAVTAVPNPAVSGDGSGASAVAIPQANFVLAKGLNCTVPAGRSIQFLVWPDRKLHEIGDYSARL